MRKVKRTNARDISFREVIDGYFLIYFVVTSLQFKVMCIKPRLFSVISGINSRIDNCCLKRREISLNIIQSVRTIIEQSNSSILFHVLFLLKRYLDIQGIFHF